MIEPPPSPLSIRSSILTAPRTCRPACTLSANVCPNLYQLTVDTVNSTIRMCFSIRKLDMMVCALILLASFVEMPTIARVLIIIFAAVTAAIGIGAAVVLDVKAGYFECPYCNEFFIPTASEYVKGYHTLTKRKLTCPKCGKSGMCKKRITR